jgi:hypothetical protein
MGGKPSDADMLATLPNRLQQHLHVFGSFSIGRF